MAVPSTDLWKELLVSSSSAGHSLVDPLAAPLVDPLAVPPTYSWIESLASSSFAATFVAKWVDPMGLRVDPLH